MSLSASSKYNRSSFYDDESPEPSLTESSISNSSYNNYYPTLSHQKKLVSTDSSLLDMTRNDDESDDEDDVTSPLASHHSYLSPPYHPTLDATTSFIDDKDTSLVGNLSETLTGSFCTSHKAIENTCTSVHTNCGDEYFTPSSNTSQNIHLSVSENIAKRRVFEDYHYLLGSSIMPCCNEKSILFSCFGSQNHLDTTLSTAKTTVPSILQEPKLKNRVGDSWRARVYRIKKLRQERMIQQKKDVIRQHPFKQSANDGLGYSYSLDSSLRSYYADSYPNPRFSSSSLENKKSGFGSTSTKKTKEVSVDALGCMIGDCIEPISHLADDVNELELVLRDHPDFMEDEEMFYDSDPGETFERKGLEKSEIKSKVSLNRSATTVGIKNEVEKKVDVVVVSPHSKSSSKQKHSLKEPFKRRRDMHFDTVHNVKNTTKTSSKLTSGGGGDSKAVGKKITMTRSSSCPVTNDDESLVSEEPLNVSHSYDECKYHDEENDIDSLIFSVQNKFEDHDVFELIQYALNHTWTLTWHPSELNNFESDEFKLPEKSSSTRSIPTMQKKSKPILSTSSRCIHLWFERGNRIRSRDIVEPKLMWHYAYRPHLSSQRKSNSTSKTSHSSGPYSVCLLSICRILALTNHIDRNKYPFAKKSCSFMIKTCDDAEYLFEAVNEKTRDRVVYLMKMVVARLASQAVVGDGEGMVGEFFLPVAFAVP